MKYTSRILVVTHVILYDSDHVVLSLFDRPLWESVKCIGFLSTRSRANKLVVDPYRRSEGWVMWCRDCELVCSVWIHGHLQLPPLMERFAAVSEPVALKCPLHKTIFSQLETKVRES